MSTRFRVAMLTSIYPPEVNGGAERQCQKVARELARRDHEVVVVTSRQRRSTPALALEDGVRVVRGWTPHRPEQLGRYSLSSLLWSVFVLRWAVAHRGQFDVIHVHRAHFQAYIGVWVGRVMGVPVVAKVANNSVTFDVAQVRRKKLVGPLFARRIMEDVDVFVSISSDITAELRAWGIESHRLAEIPNGVEPPPLSTNKAAARAALQLDRDATYYLFAGRFVYVKNVRMLARSFVRFARAQADRRVRLVMLGDGPLHDRVRYLVDSVGGGEYVHLPGRVEDVRLWGEACDYFCLPSLAEGLSNALLEAMSVGLVPIVSPVSGSRDVVADGVNGFVMAETTESALRACLRRCPPPDSDAYERLRASARSTIENQYTLSQVAAAYERLYGALVSSFRSGSPVTGSRLARL